MKKLIVATDPPKHDVKKPCSQCPWIRTVEPNALGGSDALVYIGQVHGPFFLPCHHDCDFSDPNWKEKVDTQQCAGAAIFRANVGIESMMPDFLHKLPADEEAVFSNAAQFIAHHRKVSIEEAGKILEVIAITFLIQRELYKAKWQAAVPK